MFLIFSIQVKGNIYWVSTQANCLIPDGSWACPFLKIQDALDNPLLQFGDVIYAIDDGVYQENLIWPQIDGIILSGWDPVIPGAKTWIDGNFLDRVITMTPASGLHYTNSTVVANLSLWNGFALATLNGGGIFLGNGCTPILGNIEINNCVASNGGGICIEMNRKYLFNGSCYFWQNYGTCSLQNVSINGCTATDYYGGGIYIIGSQQTAQSNCPEVDVYDYDVEAYNLILQRNISNHDGGGMAIMGGNVKWFGGLATTNSSIRNGGGLWSKRSATNLKSVDFMQNSSEQGGGAYFESGLHFTPASCADCIGTWDGFEHHWYDVHLINNSAVGVLSPSGGALYFQGYLGNIDPPSQYIDFVFEKGEIVDNHSQGFGGGIAIMNATTLYLKDINIARNIAIGAGGGIFNDSYWDITTGRPLNGFHHFEQLLITDNRANSGGGIYTRQAFTCINSTFTLNKANTSGGALFCDPLWNGGNEELNNPSFFNCILHGDKKSNGIFPNEIYIGGDKCDPQFEHCDIEGWGNINNNFDISNIPPNITWNDLGWSCGAQGMNFSFPPSFTNPGLYDYSILPTSLCKDAGNDDISCTPNSLPEFSSWFGFGNPSSTWPHDFAGNNRFALTHIDIGAYESLSKSSQIISGNQNEGNERELKIFPNPLKIGTFLSIDNQSNTTIVREIEITNCLGQTISEASIINGGQSIIEYLWPITANVPGIYLLKIKCINKEGNILITNHKICITQ